MEAVTKIATDASIFREYDIRGVVGKTLFADDAYAIGLAFACEIKENNPAAVSICVARDGRASSIKLEDALSRGLIAGGLDVIQLGLGPTPMLYYGVVLTRADGGIMITGSHNPPDHNGFKCMAGVKPFFGESLKRLHRRIETGGTYQAQKAGSISNRDIRDSYVQMLVRSFDDGGKKIKVAWDPGNGAAGEVLTSLVKLLPGEHKIINAEIDGKFPNHHPDPSVAENMQQLIELVTDGGYDLGIAFDGDADRIGVVDGEGNILWGDQLLQIYAEDVLRRQPGAAVIADVKASQCLFDRIAALGGKPVMWKTGHSLIKTKMAEIGAPLAGEMSGHMFFAANYGFDDGIYAAVRLLSILSYSDSNLAAIYHRLPHAISTPEIRMPVDESRKFKIVENIARQLREAGEDFSDVDGVRVKNEDGWWLLRASNTQAMLVARCESTTHEGLNRLRERLNYFVNSCK